MARSLWFVILTSVLVACATVGSMQNAPVDAGDAETYSAPLDSVLSSRESRLGRGKFAPRTGRPGKRFDMDAKSERRMPVHLAGAR